MCSSTERKLRYKRRVRDALVALEGAWRAAVLSPESQGVKGTLLDGRFEVRRVIARGGFATVWEGRDRQHEGRTCAVKIFRHELLDNSWMAKRFQQEVSALTQVNHPNVVGIYGHGSVNNEAPYLAMEFIEGKTLRDVLRETKLQYRQTASYLRQTASALSEIHARGICHRDVKPENLMIRSAAEPGTELVLIDFPLRSCRTRTRPSMGSRALPERFTIWCPSKRSAMPMNRATFTAWPRS